MIQVALGVILASFSAPQGQNQLFEKLGDLNAPVLKDQEFFPYLKEASAVTPTLSAKDHFGRFGTYFVYKEQPAVVLKPNAPRVKIAVCVFERVFLNPLAAASVESRDKQRILLALNRVRSMFQQMHGGDLDIDIVPKFYTEPVLRAEEMSSLVDHEFNQSVFETEDSEERGPFAAVVKLSAVGTSDFESVFDLGANRPDAKLEYQLLRRILIGIEKGANNRYGTEMAPEPGAVNAVLRNANGLKLIDPRFRATNDVVESVFQQGGSVAETGTLDRQFEFIVGDRTAVTGLDKFEGTLRYYEQSVTRSGAFLVPVTDGFLKKSAPKSVEFEVKPNTFNNLRISFGDGKGYSFGPNAGDAELKQGEWQKVSFPVPAGAKYVEIGAADEGSMRLRTELVVYQFKNFSLKDGATAISPREATGLPSKSEYAVALEKASSLIEQRRLVDGLRSTNESFKADIAFKKMLLDYSNSIDPFIAYWSAEAYGRLCFDPTAADDQALAATYLRTPPNDYARAAALEWVARWPELSNFEGISPNAVRVSWRTRLAAVQALAAQDRASSKSKLAARQMLYATTMQETAWIRNVALSNLKWSDPEEKRRLEYAGVNEASERVRLSVFGVISNSMNAIPAEVASAVLADDGATYREMVAVSLKGSALGGARDLLRRMVVDIDPRVRRAAMESILGYNDANPAEFQNLFADASVVVQMSLLNASRTGKLKLDEATKGALAKSISPTVRRMAGSLN